MKTALCIAVAITALATVNRPAAAQVQFGGTTTKIQMGPVLSADQDFHPQVAHPAYTASHPNVLFDEAHANFHTADDRYKAFADLLKADGYAITRNSKTLDAATLAGHDVLVIADARGGVDDAAADPAFAPAEVQAVAQWVEAGGSLLLVVDPPPYAPAARALATRLGVEMSAASTRDAQHHDPVSNNGGYLIFSDADSLLGDHPIVRGRNAGEAIHNVESFGGQALKGPANAVDLLKIAATAMQVQPLSQQEMDSILDAARANAAANGGKMQVRMAPRAPTPMTLHAQGIAFELGKGRVVVLGEASMLTALTATLPNGTESKIGLGVPGHDDQQFTLNILHWLSRLM